MAEGLQPPVGVDRQVAVQVEGSGQNLLPGGTPLAETQVLHEDHLGWGETVVHLGHGQVGPRVGDAGLPVGLGGGSCALGQGGEIEARVY